MNFFDFSNTESIGDRLIATQNRPSGFDYMRLALALSVICFHSLGACYGGSAQGDVWSSAWHPLIAVVLPMFFALSGFLVAGSLERSKTIIGFLGLRVLRIVPALSGEVLLSALLLGPLLTTVPLLSYFSDPKFYSYFGNIIGDIHYNLPGLFHNNPDPDRVNSQLWTIPSELTCYVVLAVLAILGIFKRRGWLIAFLVFLFLHQFVNAIKDGGDPGNLYGLSGHSLVRVFVAGVALYRFRDKIPYSRSFFILSVVISLLMLCDRNATRFVFLPIAYATVYLGLLNPPRNKLFLSGDYSYGLYLYGNVIQQTISSLSPGLRHWYLNLIICIPLTFGVAACSWWLIEKPALGLRVYLNRLEAWYLMRQRAVVALIRIARRPAETSSTSSE